MAALALLGDPETESLMEMREQLVDDHATLVPVLSAMGNAFESSELLHESLVVLVRGLCARFSS